MHDHLISEGEYSYSHLFLGVAFYVNLTSFEPTSPIYYNYIYYIYIYSLLHETTSSIA